MRAIPFSSLSLSLLVEALARARARDSQGSFLECTSELALGDGFGATRGANYLEYAHASTYWNIRFSVAGAVMDAHGQNGVALAPFILF